MQTDLPPFARERHMKTQNRPAEHYARQDASSADEISLIGIVNVVLREWRLFVIWPTVIATIALALSLALPRTFTATAAVVPQSANSALTRAAGIASQLGFASPPPDAFTSPAFLSSLASSREILKPLVLSTFVVVSNDSERTTGTLVHYLGLDSGDDSQSVARAMTLLRDKHLDIVADETTNQLRVAATFQSPQLAYAVTARLLELLNASVISMKRRQAEAEQEFVESSLERSRAELREIEDRTEAFLQRNRAIQSDPQLTFQYARLQRELSRSQAVYTTLAQAYEQQRIDAARNTPTILVTLRPEVPATPNQRPFIILSVAAIVAGLIAAATIAFLREFAARERRRGNSEFVTFEELRSKAAADVRQLLKWKRDDAKAASTR